MDVPSEVVEDDISCRAVQQRALCREMWTLRTEGTMCDVLLDVGGEQLRAHRVVLSACSPLLKALCVNPPAMSQDGLVLLRVDGFSYKVCLQLVEFLYTGRAAHLSGAGLHEYRRLCASWNIGGVAGEPPVHVTGQEVRHLDENAPAKQLNTYVDYLRECTQVSYKEIDESREFTKTDIEVSNNVEKVDTEKSSNSQRGRRKIKPRGVVKNRKRSLHPMRSRQKSAVNDFDSERGARRNSFTNIGENEHVELSTKIDYILTEDELYGGETDVDDQTTEDKPVSKLIKQSEAQRQAAKRIYKKTRKKVTKQLEKVIPVAKHDSDSVDENSLQCTICDDLFESKLELEEHDKQEHKNKRNVWCKICKIKCADKNVLKAHDVEKHWKEGMDMPKIYACQEEGCSYLTYNCKSWFAHKNFVHQPERSICDLCGKSLKSEASLKQHKQLYHTAGGTKDFSCDVCPRIFRSQVGLERHRVMVHSSCRARAVREKLVCPHCGMVYPTVTTMAEHLFKKHDIRPPPGKTGYKCEHCDYKTIKPRDFKNHQLRHYSEKQFVCATCGKSYTTQLELTRHQRLHTDSYKVHKCPHCDYSTKYGKGSLRTHILGRHQDNRPWSCSICSYSTKLKGNLHKHIRNVHKCEVNTNHRTVPKVSGGPGNSNSQNANHWVVPKVSGGRGNSASQNGNHDNHNMVPEVCGGPASRNDNPPKREIPDGADKPGVYRDNSSAVTNVCAKGSPAGDERSRDVSLNVEQRAGSIVQLSGDQIHRNIDLQFGEQQPRAVPSSRMSYSVSSSSSQRRDGQEGPSPLGPSLKNTIPLGCYHEPSQNTGSIAEPGRVPPAAPATEQRDTHFNYMYTSPILIPPGVDKYGRRLSQSQFSMLESVPINEIPSNSQRNPLMYSNMNI